MCVFRINLIVIKIDSIVIKMDSIVERSTQSLKDQLDCGMMNSNEAESD